MANFRIKFARYESDEELKKDDPGINCICVGLAYIGSGSWGVFLPGNVDNAAHIQFFINDHGIYFRGADGLWNSKLFTT